MSEILTISIADYEATLSQFGIPTRKDFHGVNYSPEKIGYLLNRPIRVGNLMSQRDTFHYNLIMGGEREKYRLQPSFRVYNGGWYRQGPEPTCLPWAVANAIYSRRIRPDAEMMVKLLDQANTKKGPYQLEGLDYDSAWRVVYHHTRLFNFDKARVQLMPNFSLLNSEVIKENLDQSRTILTGVKSDKYEGRTLDSAGVPIRDRHALCVVGYEINEDGVMNVQIIDSNLGIFWVSLEYLSASLVENETYIVGARLNGLRS